MSRPSKTSSLNAKKIIIGIVILTVAIVLGLSILKESMMEEAPVPLLTPLPADDGGQGIDDWSDDDASSADTLSDESESSDVSAESEDSSLDEDASLENADESLEQEAP